MSSAAIKAAIALIPKKLKEKAASFVKALFVFVIGLPIILLLVLFNPMSSLDEADDYNKELNNIGCGMHELYLDEVRLIEMYLSEGKDEAFMSASQVNERLRNVYFNKTFFGCAMRDDASILQKLNQDYGLDPKMNAAILEDLQQLRFEREKLIPPLERMSVRQNYSVLGLTGIELKTSPNAIVTASLSGVIKKISNSSEEVELEIECPPLTDEEIEAGVEEPDFCSEFIRIGKTVTIQHEVLVKINDMAEYEKEIIYTKYSHLGNINVNVGEEIKANEQIAKIDDELLYFRMEKEDGSIINPEDYLYLYTKISSEVKEDLKGIEMQLPLQTPYRFAAGFEFYDPFGTGATMHYGVDLAGSLNDPIYSATSGIVTNVFYDSVGGNQLWIETDGYTFVYAHMNKKASVSIGQAVSISEQVGVMGMTGKVTGVHLHFEIRDRNGRALDPSEIMEF